MKNRIVLYFYIISIFLLANGAFANYYFTMFHFAIWRQFIWIVGLLILVWWFINTKSKRLSTVMSHNTIFFCVTVILSVLTMCIYDFNFLRIAFAWWMYFSGLPFILLPYILKQQQWSNKKINYLFVCFGIFQTVGLLVDYSSGGEITKMYAISQDNTEDLLEAGRYCFLSEAPTTFGIYYCFCLLMTLREANACKYGVEKIILLFFSALYVIGAWYTGSRQIVAALCIVLVIGMLNMFIYNRKQRVYVFMMIIAISASMPYILEKLTSDEIYAERFDTEEIKNDNRSEAWAKGYQYCVGDLNVKRILIGEGVGYIMGQKANDGEVIGSHFENTIWSRMSEMGIIGLIILLYPILYVIRNFDRHSFLDMLTLSFMAAFLIICYVSPNGQHQTSQMSLYLALGFFIFNKDYPVRETKNLIKNAKDIRINNSARTTNI